MAITQAPPKSELTDEQKSLRRAAIKTGAILAGYGGLMLYARSGKAPVAGKILPNAADRRVAEKAAKAGENKIVPMPGVHSPAPVEVPGATPAAAAAVAHVENKAAAAAVGAQAKAKARRVSAKGQTVGVQETRLAARFLAARYPKLRLFGKDDYVDARGQYTDQLAAVAGVTQAHKRTSDGRLQEVDVPIHSGAVLKSAMNKGAKVYKYGQRSAGMVSDIRAVLKGETRQKDEWGRTQKREWDKPWFRNAQGAAAAGGLLIGGALVLKKNPALRAKVVGGAAKAREAVANATQLSAIRKTGHMLARRGKLTQFDETAENWDVRDARGRSARVFAPGSKERERRDKKWYERIGNQRKLMAGAAAVALAGGGAAGWMLRKKYVRAPRTIPPREVPGNATQENIVTPDFGRKTGTRFSARVSPRYFALTLAPQKEEEATWGRRAKIAASVAALGFGGGVLSKGAPMMRIAAREAAITAAPKVSRAAGRIAAGASESSLAARVAGGIKAKADGLAKDPNRSAKFVSDYTAAAGNLLNTGRSGKLVGAAIQHARKNPNGLVSRLLVGKNPLGGVNGALEHYGKFRAGPATALDHWKNEVRARNDYWASQPKSAKGALSKAKAAKDNAKLEKGHATVTSAMREHMDSFGTSEAEALHAVSRASQRDVEARINRRLGSTAMPSPAAESARREAADAVNKKGVFVPHDQKVTAAANEERRAIKHHTNILAAQNASPAKTYATTVAGVGLGAAGVGAAGLHSELRPVDNRRSRKGA